MESRRHRRRIQELADYMIRINNGIYDTGIGNREDEYSRLQDEIYKTMIAMRESREEAKKGRENLAESLTDISHQLKTPLTSVSLLQELLEEQVKGEDGRQLLVRMEQQTDHIRILTSALLTLSRLDAGVLPLEKKRRICRKCFQPLWNRSVLLQNIRDRQCAYRERKENGCAVIWDGQVRR